MRATFRGLIESEHGRSILSGNLLWVVVRSSTGGIEIRAEKLLNGNIIYHINGIDRYPKEEILIGIGLWREKGSEWSSAKGIIESSVCEGLPRSKDVEILRGEIVKEGKRRYRLGTHIYAEVSSNRREGISINASVEKDGSVLYEINHFERMGREEEFEEVGDLIEKKDGKRIWIQNECLLDL